MSQFLDMKPRPTGIFSANDRMAIGAMRAVFEAGLRIPDDVSIMGLDDIELAHYQVPPLTTVQQSFAELGTKGVELLLSSLNDEVPAETKIVLETTLIVRQSTAPPPDEA